MITVLPSWKTWSNSLVIKSLRLAVLAATLMLFAQTAQAQFVIIGTDAVSTAGAGSDPIDDYYAYNRYQAVYTAAELSSAGMTPNSSITGLGFSVIEDNGSVFSTYTVRMAHTTAINSASNNSAALTTVFGPATYDAVVTAAGSHDMITFSAPFLWNGTSNILVDICTGSSAMPYATPYGGVRAGSMNAGSRYTRSDTSPRCAINTATSNANRPQIRFNYTAPLTCTGTPNAGGIPSSLTACLGNTVTLTAAGLTTDAGISYQWQESPDGSTGWASVVGGSGATSSSYTTSAITLARYFRIETSCSGSGLSNNSNTATVTVNPGSSSEDFSSGNLTANCWAVSGTGAAQLVYNAASAFGVGIGSIQYNFYSSSFGNVLDYTSATFTALGSGMNAFFSVAGAQYNTDVDQVTLQASLDGGSSWTDVQVMTNAAGGIMNTAGSTTSGFTPTSGQWASVTFGLPVGTNRIRFSGLSSFGNRVYIDNISIAAAPACELVTGLSATVTSPSNVNIGWTASTSAETRWDLHISTVNTAPLSSDPGTVADYTGTIPYAFAAALNTPYYYWVRSDCNPGEGDWISGGTFQILGAPYTQDFSGTYLPSAWTEAIGGFNTTPTGTSSSWIQDDWKNVTSPVNKAAKINMYGTGIVDQWLISPNIAIPASPVQQAEFDLAVMAWNTPTITPLDDNDAVRFMVSTNGGTSYTVLQTWTIADGNIDGSFVYSLGAYAGTMAKFAFFGTTGQTPGTPTRDNDIMVDNFKVIAPPTCPKPTALAVIGVFPTSASVSWTENGSATAWDLYYGVSPLTAPTEATVPTLQNVSPNNPYNLTGLASQTSYVLYVRADCGLNDSSLWVGPVAFTTPCNALPAPYVENFDAATTTPACWSQSAATGGPWVFGTTSPGFPFCSLGLVDHTSGTGNMAALDMSATDVDVILTSPVIDVSALTTPALSFWVNICNTADPNTRNTIDVEAFDGVSAWTQIALIDFLTVGWEEQIYNVSSYTYGAGLVQVRFRANDNSPLGQAFVSDLHIDDFSIAEAPTCTPTVTGVTAVNINNDGAVINWDINIWNSSETYTVNYGPTQEFSVGPLAAGVTTLTLSGLTADQLILVEVVATCGAVGNSFFSTLTCDTTAQCTYTLSLYDVTGDGWNWNEYMEITSGNQAPVQYSIPNAPCTAPCATVFTFDACPTDDILVDYVGGFNGQAGDNENYWNLTGPNGFTYTQAPAAQSSNSFGACPTCPTPFASMSSNVCESSVDLSWNNGAAYDSVIVETSFGFFTQTVTRDTIVGSPTSYTVTGGAWGSATGNVVTYTIIGICSNGDQGGVSGSFTAPDCDCALQCAYELILSDSWGDGWDAGANVEIYQNGNLTQTLELVTGDPSDQCLGGPGGCSQVFSVSVCPDVALDFVYFDGGGSFAGEQSFEVIAPYSSPSPVFSSGAGPASGTTYSEIACPACPAPVGLSCSVVDYESVDVSFTSWNAGDTYQVHYNTTDDFFSATPGVTGTSASSTTATQTGLSGSTAYYFWVVEDCGGTPSVELGSSSCTTPAACPAPTAFSCAVVGPDDILFEFTAGGVGNGFTILVNTTDNEGTATVQNTGTTTAGVNQVLQGGFTDGTYYFWVIEDCGVVLGTSLTTGSTTCTIDSGAITCDWTLDLADSFGDGWDGAFLTFTVDGTPTTYTTTGFGSTFIVSVSDGVSVELAYTSGNFENEHSYVVTRPDGTTFSAGPSPATGVVLTETNSCPPPTVGCVWNLVLTDSFGDGWDGAFLTVSVDGTPTTYTATGLGSTFNVTIADAAAVVISYTSGNFETEHSYVITRPNGSTFSAGPSPATGVVLTETNTCPVPTSCDAPDITANNITAISAQISWLSTNQGGNWTLSWAPAPFDPLVDTPEGTLTGVTAGVENHSISLLNTNTQYSVCLVEDCDDSTPSSPTCILFNTSLINDLCEGALPIDCDSLISGSTLTATPTVGLLGTTGGSEAAKDVWYTFISYNQDDLGAALGTAGNEVQVSTCPLTSPGSATYDTKIDVYSGACGSLTWLTGNDDSPGCSLRSSASFPTLVGTTYYVRVYGYSGSSQGNFVLSMLCEAPCLPVPANATCSSPQIVSLQPFGTAPNIDGTNECSPAGVYPGCGSTFSTYSPSWYTFNSGPTGVVYVELALGTIAPGNLGFALYNTAPCDGTLSSVICVTGFSGIAPSQILLTPNTNYKINVFTVQGNEGSYTFAVTGPPPAPVNDDCENAINIPVVAGLTCSVGTNATFYGATETTAPDTDIECGVAGAQNDVWMKFTVPASGRVQMNYTPLTLGTGQPVWSLYRSATDCSGMTFISGSCTSTDPRVLPAYGASSTLALTPGETMYIRLWAANNTFTGNFRMCVTDPVPANDMCANATAVSVSEFGTPAWTSGNTRGAFEGNACAGVANEQVWYSFVATDPVHSILVRPLSGGTYNAVVELFDACGGTSLGCRNNYGASTIERALYSGLTPGNTYYYSVHSFLGAIGSSAAQAHETFVQGFRAGTLRAPYCGVLNYNLVQSIYAQADSYGELYTSPTPTVNGYGFRFQELPSGLDVVVQNPVTDGFYLQLQNVPGLEYGKQYDVSVQHRVIVPGNGTVDQYWSGFGPACTIGLSALPTTNIRPQYCGGTGDFYLANQLLAVQLSGASQYRFNFTPTGGGTTISELSSNYAVSLYNVGPIGGPGLLYGVSYDVTVEALITGLWTPAGTVCTIFMESQPEDTGVKAQFCNGTYLFPNSNYILAELVLGATKYEYKFTPTLGGTALTEIKNTISFAFHTTSLPFVSGTTYDVEVRAYAGGVWGDYSTMCPITVQAAPSVGGGDQTIAAKKLDASAVASLYPNPNLGESLYVSLTGLEDKPQHVVIEIMDVTGKMVYAQDVANTGKSANIILNFNEKLSRGMYFVNIYMDDTMLTEKLSIE